MEMAKAPPPPIARTARITDRTWSTGGVTSSPYPSLVGKYQVITIARIGGSDWGLYYPVKQPKPKYHHARRAKGKPAQTSSFLTELSGINRSNETPEPRAIHMWNAKIGNQRLLTWVYRQQTTTL